MFELNTKDAIDRIGDADIYKEIAQSFACHIPLYLMQINNLLLQNHIEAATRIIHSVKSNCATVGAEDLRERFASLEKIAAQGKTDEVLESMDALRQDLLQLKAVLENM